MLKIRLERIGRKNEAHFRVVLTDSKNAAKSGKFIEILGAYNPHAGKPEFKQDAILKRIKEGAQVSDTVHNFLVQEGVLKDKKRNVLSKKAPTQKRKAMKTAK